MTDYSGFPTKDAGTWADCVINNLESNGIKTIGEAVERKRFKVLGQAGTTCFDQIVPGQH